VSKLLRLVSIVAAAFVRLLDIIVRANERDGSIGALPYTLWIFGNLSFIVTLLFFQGDNPYIYGGVAAGMVVHAAILAAAFLYLREQAQVWDGLIERKNAHLKRFQASYRRCCS
jgi:hypothetical protein